MPKIMKWLLALGAVGLILAGLGAWWFTNKVSNQPRAWRAEASIELSVAPGVAFEEIADLQRWPQWSGWSRDAEPEVRRIYSGAPQGAGAVLAWDAGEPGGKVSVGGPVKVSVDTHPNALAGTVGKGTVRILSAEPDKALALETRFEKALWLAGTTQQGSNVTQRSSLRTDLNGTDFVVTGRFTLEPVATGTRVRWVEEGTFGDGFAGGMLAMAMHGMVERKHAEILSVGLERLKQHLEAPR